MIPAASGADADVPVWESVHFCLRSVVTLETGEERERGAQREKHSEYDTLSFSHKYEWSSQWEVAGKGWGQWKLCLQRLETRRRSRGRRGRRREWAGRFSLRSVDPCQRVTDGAVNVSQIGPARSGCGGETKYVSTAVAAAARKLMRPVWVTMGTVSKWQKARGAGEPLKVRDKLLVWNFWPDRLWH